MCDSQRELSKHQVAFLWMKECTLSTFAFQHVLCTPERIELWAGPTQYFNLVRDGGLIHKTSAIATKLSDEPLSPNRPVHNELAGARIQEHIVQQIGLNLAWSEPILEQITGMLVPDDCVPRIVKRIRGCFNQLYGHLQRLADIWLRSVLPFLGVTCTREFKKIFPLRPGQQKSV